MKYVQLIFLFGLLLLLVSTNLISIKNDRQSQLGNVVYSVLELEDFTKENGKGWVLLNGEEYLESKLSQLYSVSQTPNAQGSFIRIVDLEKDNKKRRDTDRPFGTSIGHYQADNFKQHKHKVKEKEHSHLFPGDDQLIFYAKEHSHVNYDAISNTNGNNAGQMYKTTAGKTNLQLEAKGGSETRPKNIILYAYIKIN